MTLLAMRLTGVRNAVRGAPGRHLAGLGLLAALFWGVLALARRGVAFLDAYPAIGTVADAVVRRSLEGLFLTLMLGVAFSVLTTAVTTLYASDDLPLLLSLPVPAERVFALKVAETYLGAALLPAVFTLPVVLGLGLERSAPLVYYPLATAAVLALFALPVALGCLLALGLMRVAPAGRVKEAATALSVLLAAGLILSLRALRPEQLAALSPEEFELLLARFADFDLAWLPSAWASSAVWEALEGRAPLAGAVLLGVALFLLWGTGRLAATAYRAGWMRSLDGGRGRRDVSLRPPAAWERALDRFGPAGAVVAKDLRLLLRDPTQWSQLLVLVAMAGVYLVSTASIDVPIQRFRDALGTMNLAFLAFLLAGVGVRTAFPVVSMEGEGLWLLRTGPLPARAVVLAKFGHALPAMLLLGGGIGLAAARMLDLSPTLAWASPIGGAGAAMAVTGLGVGLGAAFPRFDAPNPAEVPLSPGGVLYMTLATAYAVAMAALLAAPAWQALRRPDELAWGTPLGAAVLAAFAALTAATTLLPLWLGWRALERYEPGR